MTDEAYRRLQEDRCKAKHRYRSAQAAKNALRWREIMYGCIKLRIYKCDICGGHHFTSNDSRDYDLREFEKGLREAVAAGVMTQAEKDAAVKQFKLQQKKGGDAM